MTGMMTESPCARHATPARNPVQASVFPGGPHSLGGTLDGESRRTSGGGSP